MSEQPGSDPSIPTQEELQALADRLMLEFKSRFVAPDADLSVGRVRSLISRGIGLEINGQWDSFHAAKRSLFRRQWILKADLSQIESAV